jgi:hypothetical protein
MRGNPPRSGGICQGLGMAPSSFLFRGLTVLVEVNDKKFSQ